MIKELFLYSSNELIDLLLNKFNFSKNFYKKRQLSLNFLIVLLFIIGKSNMYGQCSTSYSNVTVVGATSGGTVWGTGPFTYDSSMGMAAVYQGIMSVGQVAVISQTNVGNLSSYNSGTQNGVSTASYSSFCGVNIALVSWVYTPVITSLSTYNGSVGSSIIINGGNLADVTSVKFNGVSATSFTKSLAGITVTVPSGATTGSIEVTNPYGSYTFSSFTVQSPSISTSTSSLSNFSSCIGSASTAQTFTVSGTNLTSNIDIAALTGYEFSQGGTTYTPTLSLTPSSGTLNSTTVYARLVSSSSGSPSGNISLSSTGAVSKTIAVNGVVNSLTTIASQPTSSISVCQNGSSTLGVSAIGGGLTYQWYTNTTNSTTGGTSLGSSNGAQTATLTLNTTIAGTKYYYVLVTGSCGAAVTSTTSAVTISPTTVSGTISGTTSICSGTTTSLTLAGNVGTVQWQSSTDNSSWANISGETSSSYTTPVLNATTYYRANVISGVCSSSNTSAITITVNSLPSTPTVAITNIDYCQGSTAAALSATATTGHTLIWPILQFQIQEEPLDNHYPMEFTLLVNLLPLHQL